MRRLLYVAHPVAPTEEEIGKARARSVLVNANWGLAVIPSDALLIRSACRANVRAAGQWLQWLRRSFPETSFIAPWIVSILTGDDDSDPAQREAGLVDCCSTVERCDGIVLCGGRISTGMRREMKAGLAIPMTEERPNYFEVYDLTSYQIEGDSGKNRDGRTFERWMDGYRESCTR